MPSERPARDAEALLGDLDPDQRLVATTFGAPVAVLAGAGTGKTRAITYRVAYGALTGAYQAQAVLAVTFTTRAAGELRDRLRRLGVPSVQARTFHSAALRQARYFWPQAMGRELPDVTGDRLPIVAEACRRLRLETEPATLRDLLTEVSWAKVSNVQAADYAELAPEAGREVAGLDATSVGWVLGRYEQVKTERGVIDFDDILLCDCALLADHPDVAAQVRDTYRHLVVDEYQDVSPLQQTLLDLWRGDGTDLCVVGDPAQTIHSFAGATPAYLVGFAKRFPDATVLTLRRDYRSTPQVVALANSVARAADLGTVELKSQRPSGPVPSLEVFDSEPAEAAGVAAWLRDRHADGVPWRELAVLYRVHAQSPAHESALADAGVPFVIRDAEGFFERAEVRQALGALAERARRDPAQPALAAARDVLTRLGWTDAPPAGQGRARERWESWDALFTLAGDVVRARVSGTGRVEGGGGDVARVSGTGRVEGGGGDVARASGPGVDAGGSGPTTPVRAPGSATVADLVAELRARTQLEHAPAGDGVTLSSLHAAKGLEWEAVAVTGVQEGTLPLSFAVSPEQVAEEARLFYVGVTRARTRLLLTWSRARRDGSASRTLSRFLDGVPMATPTRPAPVPAREPYRPATALSETCRVCGLRLTGGAEHKLGRHLACPADYDERTLAELMDWRDGVASDAGLPAFAVLTEATLITVAEARPADVAALAGVPGVGRAKAGRFGRELLAILEAGRAREAARPRPSEGERPTLRLVAGD